MARSKAQAATTEEREQKFIEAILSGSGKREAAIAAGYSPRTAHQIATELLERPRVKDRLESYYRRDEAEVLISREILRRRLFELATADSSEAYNDDWELRPAKEIPLSVRRLVLSVRKWESEKMGSGSSAKFLNPEQVIKTYLRLFPAPPPATTTLEDAAAAVEQEMDALFARMDGTEGPDEDDEDEEEDDGSADRPS